MVPSTAEQDIGSSFRALMRRYPATVTIVTGRLNEVDHGMTVTAVASVSMDPPSLLVCLNNRSYLHEMLMHQPMFAVNVLAREQGELSDAFSGKLSAKERFGPHQWNRHQSGLLTLVGAHATVICRRAATVPYGTHTLFIGEVADALLQGQTKPLLYEDAQYCSLQPV